MRTNAMLIAVCCVLVVGALGTVHAQSRPESGPSFDEAHAVWKGVWTALITGDLNGARQFIHSERQHLLPGRHKTEDLQQLATQMAYCRLDPNPLPVDLDEVIYRVFCERGGETAESQVGLRRDRDGSWRLSIL